MRITNYDTISPRGYEARYRTGRYPGIEQVLLAFAATVRSGGLLEVGAGTGHWLRFLHDHSCPAVGLDLSATMLGHARREHPDALLVRGRAEALPFPDQTFERLVCINAFHHFTDKARFLTEVRRVLRPSGGFLSIGLDPHAGRDRWWIYDYFPETVALDRARYPSAAELRMALAEAGFAHCNTREAEHIVVHTRADSTNVAGYLDRSLTSQCMILTDREFELGARRVLEAAGLGRDSLSESENPDRESH